MAQSGQPPREPPPGHPRFIWPTPNQTDLLFWIWVDMRLPQNATWTAGTAHPDAATYPNHKLLHAMPQAPDGWSKWYYVSDRVGEDAYNWEYSQADIGGRKFDSVMRTYLVPRSSFAPGTPAPGATMPNTPAALFTGTYLLAGREETRTGDEMFDSLYVVDRRNYVKRATLRMVDVDRRTGMRAFEYTTLYYRGELVDGKAIEDLFAGTQDGLFGVSASAGTTTTGKQLSDNWFAVSVTSRIPLNGWTSGSSPTIVWREFSTTSLGGFKFDIFDSLWLMNKASQNEATPAPGTVLTTSDWSLATTAPNPTYLLFDRKQEWVDAEFDTKYILERRRYFKRRQSADIAYDEATDDHLLVTEDLYYRAEVPSGESLAIEVLIQAPTSSFWGPSVAGTLKEGRTVSDDWFLVTTRQVVPAAYADGTLPFRDYYTNVNFSWPPVLEDIEIMDWVLKDGATRNFPRPVWKRYAYNGPTSVRIREYWRPTKWDLSADLPEVMLESPIHYPSPIQPISVPACLHPTITCRSDTGTSDPDFGVNVGSARVFPATNYTDWPTSLYIEKSQQPSRGGWRKRTVQAFSPDDYPVVAPA